MTTQIEVRTDMAEMTDRGDLGPPPLRANVIVYLY